MNADDRNILHDVAAALEAGNASLLERASLANAVRLIVACDEAAQTKAMGKQEMKMSDAAPELGRIVREFAVKHGLVAVLGVEYIEGGQRFGIAAGVGEPMAVIATTARMYGQIRERIDPVLDDEVRFGREQVREQRKKAKS